MMRFAYLISTYTLAVFLLPLSGETQETACEQRRYMDTIESEQYVCRRTEGTIDIDGRIDEAVWQRAPWSYYFRDIEGDRKSAPRFKTRVKMLWDNRYFYIAAELEEPHVWGTMVFRDQIMFHENDFELFIDPDSDNHEYYEIEISPLNAIWDLLLEKPYRDGGPAVHTWQLSGIKSGIHVNGTINDPRDIDKGWTVEFALPWDALQEYAHKPTPPFDGDIWRINFSRVEWEHEIVTSDHTTPDISGNAYRVKDGVREDNWVWSPQGIVNMHAPEKWGYVMFSDTVCETAAFRPDPTADARRVIHDVYYAQRDFKKNNGRYALTLEELELPFDYSSREEVRDSLRLEGTPDGYKATVTATGASGEIRLTIRQDSKVTAARK